MKPRIQGGGWGWGATVYSKPTKSGHLGWGHRTTGAHRGLWKTHVDLTALPFCGLWGTGISNDHVRLILILYLLGNAGNFSSIFPQHTLLLPLPLYNSPLRTS